MRYCPYCDSNDLTITSAGLDWLVECGSCHEWWHITDSELRSMA